MRTDRRRLRGFFADLVDDKYRKLAAIGLGVALWFFIDSRIQDSHTRRLPLEIAGAQGGVSQQGDRLAVALPTDRVLDLGFFDGERRIEHVEIKISGPRFRIDALRDEALSLSITSFLSRDWSVSASVEFTAADVRTDQALLRDVSIELNPARIRLDVERIEPFQVPLESMELVELQGDDDRLDKSSARFSPSMAVILGPAINVRKLKERGGRMFSGTFGSPGSDKEVTTTLELIGGKELGLTLQTKPQLTMKVRPQMRQFLVKLLVLVDDVALPESMRGRYRPDPGVRPVRIKVGGALSGKLLTLSDQVDKSELDQWVNDNLRLFVLLTPSEAGGALGQTIDRQARLVVVGKFESQVDRGEALLDEAVTVTLRQTPQ